MSWKRKLAYALGAIFLVLAGGAIWMLGPALLPAENTSAGIAIGGKAPIEMELLDSTGRKTTLAANMGEKGQVLLLVRSADWCPFCRAQLAKTEEIRGKVDIMGYSLAALSYDKPELLAEFAAENGTKFVLLSDTGSLMIDALGLRDPQYERGSFAFGVPRASILVLGIDGTVKAKFVAADYRSRQSNEDVLRMIESVRD